MSDMALWIRSRPFVRLVEDCVIPGSLAVYSGWSYDRRGDGLDSPQGFPSFCGNGDSGETPSAYAGWSGVFAFEPSLIHIIGR